jgi:hypothetical protein
LTDLDHRGHKHHGRADDEHEVSQADGLKQFGLGFRPRYQQMEIPGMMQIEFDDRAVKS